MVSVGACIVAVLMELDLDPLSNHDNLELLRVVAGSTPTSTGELGRVPLRVAQSIKMLSKKTRTLLSFQLTSESYSVVGK